MGHNLRVLRRIIISPSPDIGPIWFQTERAEEIHLHWRNMRLLMGLGEYNTFCQGIAESYARFKALGKGLGQPFDLLHRRNKIPPQSEVDSTLFTVELQDPNAEGDKIHVHYRNYRFDFTKREFKQFAKTISEALENLANGKDGDDTALSKPG